MPQLVCNGVALHSDKIIKSGASKLRRYIFNLRNPALLLLLFGLATAAAAGYSELRANEEEITGRVYLCFIAGVLGFCYECAYGSILSQPEIHKCLEGVQAWLARKDALVLALLLIRFASLYASATLLFIAWRKLSPSNSPDLYVFRPYFLEHSGVFAIMESIIIFFSWNTVVEAKKSGSFRRIHQKSPDTKGPQFVVLCLVCMLAGLLLLLVCLLYLLAGLFHLLVLLNESIVGLCILSLGINANVCNAATHYPASMNAIYMCHGIRAHETDRTPPESISLDTSIPQVTWHCIAFAVLVWAEQRRTDPIGSTRALRYASGLFGLACAVWVGKNSRRFLSVAASELMESANKFYQHLCRVLTWQQAQLNSGV